MLKVCEVGKSFEENQVVLKNINFELEKGEFICLVGESGSGKTTLLKIIAGLLNADAGEVTLDNKKIEGPGKNLVPGHEEINLVFQDFALKNNMTVEENINYMLLGYEEHFKKQRIETLIKICGLENERNKMPSSLSGGQKQRVAFSRALATEPEIILMDEPFSNLDPLTKQNLLQETKSIAKKTQTSIVLVTHDTRDAMEVADRIIVLQNGEITQSGSPENIYQSPGNTEIAGYFGLINILSAKDLKTANSSYVLKNSESYGLWAENIHCNRNAGMKGVIEKVVFSGSFNKLLVKTSFTNKIWIYDFEKKFNYKDIVSLSFEFEKLIFFNK